MFEKMKNSIFDTSKNVNCWESENSTKVNFRFRNNKNRRFFEKLNLIESNIKMKSQ